MPSISDRLATALADRYRLESELGEGGMAKVYLAHDVKHDRSGDADGLLVTGETLGGPKARAVAPDQLRGASSRLDSIRCNVATSLPND